MKLVSSEKIGGKAKGAAYGTMRESENLAISLATVIHDKQENLLVTDRHADVGAQPGG